MASELNMAEVRGSFPALNSDQVFFDNAGGSQALATVVDRIKDYLLNTNVQLGATYATGRKSTARYAEGYAAAAKYINASVDEIVLGSSTTQLYRNLSQTLTFSPGDEVIISAVDHEANIASWLDLARRQGLTVKWWKPPVSTNPKLTPDNLRPLLTSKTRLVSLTHASNILGTIHDVKAIASLAHAVSPAALVCVDAVAYAPHRRIDVKELGVDAYSFSWYKVYGPHISMLYVSGEAQKGMASLGHYFNPHATLENKMGLAGASYELVYAVPAVVEYLNPEGGESKWEGIVAQEGMLQEVLLGWARGRGDVTVYGEGSGDTALRVPTVSFRVRGWGSWELVEAVEGQTGFGFRWGSFYSVRLVEEVLGLEDSRDGVVRVSMVHYNTVDEVRAFIAALEKVLASKES
ncbi:aminotransferase class-V [Coniochaeta ligniaria NRRL 30616]|uniref:Aminotransferase class-V n=1 Tax=Coniochaeta ligniaria NRRL 30616 TaxID=1408157 RepID=A0A1J7JQB7_9PEZI|nr:aminotransferase class-V [Coniochaeta ligniaria NRRL 30616]